MFSRDQPPPGRSSRWGITGLALLSVTSLFMTAWILADVSREQELLKSLARSLPASDLPEARELAGGLRLQWRLTSLLTLDLLGSGVALTLLVRAYISSERSLRDVKVLATDILDSIDQGIITTDREGTVLSVNPHGRVLLDIAPGTAMDELPAEHAALAAVCRGALDGGTHLQDQDYAVERDGHVRHFRAGSAPLKDHKQRNLGAVVHLWDVTEKNLMGQRLRRMERYMGLGSLAAGLQHEIKNPLSALSLHVQLLDEALSENGPAPEIREMLDVLHTETRRISGVLEGFRDFASVAKLNLTEVDLSQMIGNLVRLMEPEAAKSGIRIELTVPEEAVRLIADAGRIEQVLLNLVVNAIAAMPEGGALAIRIEPRPDSVRFEVADTGGGIPAEFRDKVFDPYFTTRSAGTGMGLALSEKIVRQHNGAIEFQTGPDGTTFTFSLPRNGPS